MRNDSSFIELKARERARLLLDDGSFRELLDPFDGICRRGWVRRVLCRSLTTAWWWQKAPSTASLPW